MAANDPSFDVPTPRGVLQGVAVFTHDGANWQPAGRAATEVATPTGVLRGVAAFTGGTPWSPATRAQTEVPTPSGVLDGVAVYTWSGTAWVPPSGNIEVATPSGVLEGVAQFSWDGTTWQPAAQASSEVPTPYGVLTGVAPFGWTGSAWAAVSSGPPGMTLDLNFMNPGTLDPRIAFTRASTATYTDASGVIQTAATNAPRWDYANGTLLGLLIEEARTNLLLNSASLSTQSVTTTATAYTLSFYGTGTVTKSGTATGALVGTGAGQRVTQTFTPTAGTLTLTVTGSVVNAQIETGGFATSWVSTAGATATRARDSCLISPANMSPWFASPGGSWFAEFISQLTFGANNRLIGVAAGGGGQTPLYINNTGASLSQFDGVGVLPTANSSAFNTVMKGASGFTPTTGKTCLNGGAVASGTLTGGYAALGVNGVNIFSDAGGATMTTGYIRRIAYWPRVLSDAEMQSVTT